MDQKDKKEKKEKPVTVHITNHNKFEKGVGAFITNLNHLTIVMDSEGNMKLDANQVPAPVMPHTEVDAEEEQPEEDDKEDRINCFKFMNEFIRQKVEAVVNTYYQGSAANLALIEITFFDHNLLKKRNTHTAFIKTLCAWGTIGPLNKEEIKDLMNAMASKMSDLPKYGYMEWDGSIYVNDKKTCQDISKDLGEGIKYSRKKDK
jgi:hypothetical protein